MDKSFSRSFVWILSYRNVHKRSLNNTADLSIIQECQYCQLPFTKWHLILRSKLMKKTTNIWEYSVGIGAHAVHFMCLWKCRIIPPDTVVFILCGYVTLKRLSQNPAQTFSELLCKVQSHQTKEKAKAKSLPKDTDILRHNHTERQASSVKQSVKWSIKQIMSVYGDAPKSQTHSQTSPLTQCIQSDTDAWCSVWVYPYLWTFWDKFPFWK